ncbi:immunity protein Imm33 domain-containing protein [Metapseudomonas boanensis]|uniref:Imm33-like domain-containing protein n=1 Tax=Metapseudomonas boanensis TaxID=2822138 RepID=A0ABS5XN89_9GAMM|nr:hypothetical protein [Pseudomonas boanensis]MBT8769167.1 hypothetical protein [Pseudomonas boanensis]
MEAQPTQEQLAICQRFSAEMLAPALTEKLGIALSTLHQLPFTAVRHLAVNGTCGWYIWGGEYCTGPEFFQALHVAHISEHCPQIQPYLALAPGWGVVLAPGYEDVWFDQALLVE